MNHLRPILEEFVKEAEITKKVMDRVPADKLAWKPHKKSMTLGQLALHIAKVPGGIAYITKSDRFDASQNNFDPPTPQNLAEIHAALEQSVRDVRQTLNET